MSTALATFKRDNGVATHRVKGAGSDLHFGAGGASFLARARGIYFTPANLLALIEPKPFDPLSLIVNPPRP
jgi:hypothetical protein